MPKRARSAKRSSRKGNAKRAKRSKSAKSSSAKGKRSKSKKPAYATKSRGLAAHFPKFGGKPTSKGGVVVSHREFISDIVSDGDPFTITQLNINPGLSGPFPWLSRLAQNFEEYRIHKMQFRFRSTYGNAVSSNDAALGVVICATQYNALNSPFTAKGSMENYQGAQSGAPSEDIMHTIDLQQAATPAKTLYLRGGSIPDGSDLRLYDIGAFYIATAGQQASATVGELWCTYTIELIKPRIAATQGSYEPFPIADHFNIVSAITNTNPLGSASIGQSTGSNGGGFVTQIGVGSGAGYGYRFADWNTPAAGIIPVGTPFLVLYLVYGSSTATTGLLQLLFNSSTNYAAGNSWFDNTALSSVVTPSGSTTSTMFCLTSIYKYQSAYAGMAPNGFTINVPSGTAIPSSPTAADLFVIQMPENIT